MFLAGLFALAIYLARRERLVSFCILWFFINLVIESSVIGLELIFEHRLYLPMFGIALVSSYLIFSLLSGKPRYNKLVKVLTSGCSKRFSRFSNKLCPGPRCGGQRDPLPRQDGHHGLLLSQSIKRVEALSRLV